MIMLYFSGTGNSCYLARMFAASMGAGCHSIEEDVDFSSLIARNEVIGFCYPIYGSRLPRILREFIGRHLDELAGKKVIIFCTQMLFSGDGARVLTDLFGKHQVEVIYAEHFRMPNNIGNFFLLPLKNGAANQAVLARAERRIARVCDDIRTGRVKKRGFNFFSRLLGLTQGAFMQGIERKAQEKLYIDAGCNACGLCVSICPMHNLELSDGQVLGRRNCTLCYRCVNQCPQQAITVYLPQKVKRQYLGVGKYRPAAEAE